MPTTKAPPKEEWRPVIGYEGIYEVSSHGRIKSFMDWRGSDTRILKSCIAKNLGYPIVSLGGKRFYVHRLVAEAFIGPCPKRHEVNHIDGTRSNNLSVNLEYVTHLKNIWHSIQKIRSTRALGEKASKAKLTASKVFKIRKLRKNGMTLNSIATKFGVTNQAIDAITKYRSWRHV